MHIHVCVQFICTVSITIFVGRTVYVRRFLYNIFNLCMKFKNIFDLN